MGWMEGWSNRRSCFRLDKLGDEIGYIIAGPSGLAVISLQKGDSLLVLVNSKIG
jgi:hypothetical protein